MKDDADCVVLFVLPVLNLAISDISSDKEHFGKAAPIYNEALKDSGFNEILKFLPSIPTRPHRGKNIILFSTHHVALILKVHSCRFENLPICSCSHKNNTLKISHS